MPISWIVCTVLVKEGCQGVWDVSGKDNQNDQGDEAAALQRENKRLRFGKETAERDGIKIYKIINWLTDWNLTVKPEGNGN